MPWTDSQTWDLESILPGGLDGERYKQSMAQAEDRAAALVPRADALGPIGEDPAWADVIPALEQAYVDLGEPYAWLHCVTSAHSDRPQPQRELGRAGGIASRLSRAWTRPEAGIARASDAELDALEAHPSLAPFAPMFLDMKARAKLLLPPGEQSLAADLAESSHNEWSRLYNRLSGRLKVQVGDETLSPGQAFNLLDHEDAAMRRRAFEGMNSAWSSVDDDCAAVLSNLTGTRQVLADRVGASEVDSPLTSHRLDATTLDAMMDAARAQGPLVGRYLRAKARLLGHDRLDFCDLRAPVGEGSRTWTWAEAQDFVVEQMESFSTDMADYAKDAFARRHIEAEDRGQKRAGAFCIGFSVSKQSRVFMTFGGTTNNVLTLAHELGHAYHNHVMWDLHRSQRRVPSTLAESASTFAEALVRGAAMDRATTDAERLALLDEDLGSATTMLANIPVRYAFERELFRLRRDGPLSPDRLSDAMVRLQRDWYGDALGAPDPMFWASKMHFFMSRPFYNYPYTFGYLFSGLIWARAMAEGPAWAGSYRDLLRDTGAGPCEDVAHAHLGLDLRDPAGWLQSVAGLKDKVERFEALASTRVAAK